MGSEAPAETTPPDLEPCKQCRAPIPVDARLCRHCSSYQDWRGHLSISNTVLALLVALVSVLSVALPALVGALRSSHSRVVVSNPVVRGEVVYLVASNSGTRPGVIRGGRLNSKYLETAAQLDLTNPADALVTPGAKQIGLNIGLRLGALDSSLSVLSLATEAMKHPEAQAGTVVVSLLGSDGGTNYAHLPITYVDLMTLLRSHAARCGAAKGPPSFENGCSGIRELAEENDQRHERLQKTLRGLEGAAGAIRQVRENSGRAKP